MLIQYAIKDYALIPGQLFGTEFIPSPIEITPNEFVLPYKPFSAETVYDTLENARYALTAKIRAIADDLLNIQGLNNSPIKVSRINRVFIRRKLSVVPAVEKDGKYCYLVYHPDGITVKYITAAQSDVFLTHQAAVDNLVNLLKRQ